MMSALPWFILLLPLLAAAVIALVTKPWPGLSAFISVAAALAGFAMSCLVFATPHLETFQITWLDLKPVLYVPIGFVLDELSRTMLLVVTGVGAVIHVYSLGYMRDDSSKSRYFASLSFFMFSMLGIVVANNFVMMFIFWELVGVSSYLLIGHWFEKASAAEAAKKAFLTNRIGDFGFMLGILMAWVATGSVVFSEMNQQLGRLTTYPDYLTIAALLIFCGAVGKSAQFPLHVWLPDAMEGPTPISALIHAATMVAAGVYMLVRIGFLIDASPEALSVIAWIGTITAVLAALIATQQNDIKRILAYSTLSQLGYMIMAIGLASGQAAMFHLFTHAFFKALLFLGAGSIIVMLHHEDGWARRPARDHLSHFHGRHPGAHRAPAVQRFFQQGRDPVARLRKKSRHFLARPDDGVPDRVLHVAIGGGRFLWPATERQGPGRTGSAVGNDRSAGCARDSGADGRVQFRCQDLCEIAGGTRSRLARSGFGSRRGADRRHFRDPPVSESGGRPGCYCAVPRPFLFR
jgi:formate hydrogenlyase subunit 3/multisubunit Na+/H+ antiporter MnhD subunit